MKRAIQLAQRGAGLVSPNPMVGCVIAHNDRILGEGWHKKYGEAHAEVNAIAAVNDKELLKESVLYVTLEPCAHYGKTPPCADLILAYKIPKVVVATLDPNPLVSGKGIEKLKNGGVNVHIGLLQNEAKWMNRKFLKSFNLDRPFIILKWAQTSQGIMAAHDKQPTNISNSFSQTLSHKWRTEEDAILVGYNTAYYDNPKLTARYWIGKNPIRIILDRNLQIPHNHHLLYDNEKTWIINSQFSDNKKNKEWIQSDMTEQCDWLTLLKSKGIQSIIIEGGKKTLQALINKDLWDEIRIFTSIDINFDGESAPIFKGKLQSSIQLHTDNLEIYSPQ